MTVKELYEWAIKQGCEDYNVTFYDIDEYNYVSIMHVYKNDEEKTIEIE